MSVNSKRPVNLDLTTVRLPLPAYTSILHRISGVILFAGIAFLLYGFELSLSSEQGYQQFVTAIKSPVAKFVTWGLLTGLGYHMVAGIKHLLMDVGIAEDKESGVIAAKVTLTIGVVLSLLAGIWVW